MRNTAVRPPAESSSPAEPARGPGSAPSARVRVCGPLTVEIGGRRLDGLLPGRKGPQLVAYLAINRHRAVRREELIDVLWPVDPPARPEGAFATLLTRTRTALGHDHLTGGTHLRLALGPDPWIDWEIVHGAVEAAAEPLAGGEPAVALQLAGEALAIIEQGFLPNVEAAWIDERRRELEELRVPLSDALARAALALGGSHVKAAERAARAIVEREPFREDGYALLMEALAAGGNDAEALRVYDELRTLLREQLGLTPAPAITAVAERVLRRPPEPVRAHAGTRPEPEQRARDGPRELPAVLAAVGKRPLVDREDERRWVLDITADVTAGHRRVALVYGEPGIGKTRLAACVSALLHERGWTVLHGRADRESPVTYQPLLEALRQYLAQRPELDPELERMLGPELAELSRRLPALRRLAVESHELRPGEAEIERFRVFEAVAALFASAAGGAPALLVLEDLHWADRSTLMLLRHVVHSTEGCRILVLGTYRDVDAAAAEPLHEFLDELWHQGLFDRLALQGLALGDTGALVRAHIGGADPELVRRLHGQTNGNPFYVEETLRGLSDGGLLGPEGACGDRFPVPDRVQQMIEWRVERLAAPAPVLLKAAAVLGPEFELARAASVAGCSTTDAIAALADASRAGLVVTDPARVDRYAFRHALVREALHEATPPGQRARLHLAAGELLEPGGGDPAELAVHFSHARDVGGAERAVHWRLAAAEQATRRYAHEESVEHHRHALAALELLPADDLLRARILLGKGQAETRAGELEQGRATLRTAAELGRRVGAGDIVADCVMDAGAFYLSEGKVDTDFVALLEDALRRLEDDPGDAHLARRARVTARLVVALYWDPDAHARRVELATEAVRLARASGDLAALAFAVGSRHCADWVSERPAELLVEAERTIELAQRAGDEEFELLARGWRVNHLLGLARIDRADEEIDRFVALAGRLHQSRCVWYAPVFLGIRAMIEGRLDEAERQIVNAATLGGRVPGSPAPMVAGAQIFFLRWLQGRLGELEPAVSAFVEKYPALPAWRCAMAMLESEVGNLEHSRRLLDELAADGFESVPRDNLWLVAMALAAEACAATGAQEHAAALERKLAPLAGVFVVSPTAAWFGPIDRQLGLLAAVQGRRDEAVARLTRAAQLCEQARSTSLLTLVRRDHAEVLLDRGAEGDAEAARALARAALTGAEACGMRAAAARALAILASTDGDVPEEAGAGA
jgi:DNA-binding SARP family transcriptional activator/tetratricopeptide (TPR) repeat protein